MTTKLSELIGECPHINISSRFQVSSAGEMRTALFWAITQQVMVILYRRFGTAHRPNLQG